MKRDDDVTGQNVNQSRTTENDSAREVYQKRIQEKVETIWLFDTGADAPSQRFHWKIKVQFTALLARDARRCLLSGTQTQNEGKHVLFESTRKFPHSTERRPKNNNVTRRKH